MVLKRAGKYLGVIFAIFKRDLWRILKNPIALIITLGMIVMPSAYAWYVVAANWDPYNNTEDMRIAVVNNDKGYESPDLGSLDVGEQVVTDLKENTTMGWEFVDEEEALNGVYAGTYWAALIIPEDFSEDFASVTTGHFTQPELAYYVNEKPSSIAPKVTDAAASAVEDSINRQFIETVADKVVTTTQEVGSYAESKADEADSQLTAGISRAHETVSQTRTTLDGLAAALETTKDSVTLADDTLGQLEASLPTLESTLAEAQTLLGSARTSFNHYGSTLSANVVQGSLALTTATTEAKQLLGSVAGALTQTQSTLNGVLTQAEALLADNQRLIDQLEVQLAQDPSNTTVAQALSDARNATTSLQLTVDSLRTAQDELAQTLAALTAQAQALDEAAQSGAGSLKGLATTFESSLLPAATASLDTLSQGLGTLQGAVQGLAPTLTQSRAVLAELNATLTSSSTSLTTTAQSLATMEENLDRCQRDLEALQNSATVTMLSEYLQASPSEIGSFMAAPVALDTHLVYPVKNYGSGVCPFFTNLALWVAGFILMAMVKLRVDPQGLPKFSATQAYFGRWLFYVVCGLAMGLVCCVGDLILGIQCEHPLAFIGAGLLTVFVDVNLMYALAYAFRHIGKAIAVILLIVQIPGSSGMFPIEMMPAFFQAIHPLLPFTYSIDAMREAIGGFYGWDYLHDMLLLGLLFVPLGLFIGLGIGRKDFNLNIMFDQKLGATDLLLAEPVPKSAKEAGQALPAHYRTRTLIKALLDTDAFHSALVTRAARFRKHYPTLVRIGWVALIAQPLITFAVMVAVHATVDVRIEMLMAMVGGIIVVDLYLIVITYLNNTINQQLALANLSPEAMKTQAGSQLGVSASPKSPGEEPQPSHSSAAAERRDRS